MSQIETIHLNLTLREDMTREAFEAQVKQQSESLAKTNGLPKPVETRVSTTNGEPLEPFSAGRAYKVSIYFVEP